MSPAIPPSLIYFAGALLVLVLPGVFRKAAALLTAVAGFGFFFLLSPLYGGGEPVTLWSFQFLDFDLVLGKIDGWRLIFYNIFALLSIIGVIFILNTKGPLEYSAGLLYAGSALGVVLAGDLISLFVFWELLTVGAVLLILARKTERSTQAALRYFTVHVLGGVILLAGIALHIHETGSLAVEKIALGSPASWLIFIGVGVNSAWPILGAWLTDTYPEASVGGIVFMATYTTKSAIFVLAQLFAGESYLIWIGSAMALIPLFYAVIENDLRRVLAYCLINQVGFMVIGVGLGTDLSLNGTAAHAYCHILYKALLFMSVGAVIFRTGKSKATELGGLYKSMPITCIFCCIGAASISAPLFGGFVSKSMVLSAAAGGGYSLVWLILLFASVGVFLLAGIKITYFAFFSRDAGHRCEEAPLNMLVAMGITAFMCIFVGSFPNAFLYKMLPTGATYQPYTVAHVTDQYALLFFSALGFILLIRSGLYPAEIRSTNVDADVIYRKGGRLAYRIFDKSLNGLNTGIRDLLVGGLVSNLSKFFADAPARIGAVIMTPIWAAGGVRGADLSTRRKELRESIRSGAGQIGVTACFAVVLLGILFLIRIS
ncbi:Na(+)/H(+) antiporter subunit D [Haloferula sp.]|uniref:Na(+)/H(+) antiporter subunit D n=1 Tax=Haloferula sp. TaxID=2497595 RepID=UPI00329F7047